MKYLNTGKFLYLAQKNYHERAQWYLGGTTGKYWQLNGGTTGKYWQLNDLLVEQRRAFLGNNTNLLVL